MVKIRDIMHRGVIFCYLGDSVKEGGRIMDENNIRGVVVVEESGKVKGFISNTDLIRCYDKNVENVLVDDIMHPFTMEVDPDWPIKKAIEIMIKNRYEHLIIVDNFKESGKPVAVLTSYDIVQYMSGMSPGMFKHDMIMK
jgi:predicted transcriptional regulator